MSFNKTEINLLKQGIKYDTKEKIITSHKWIIK